MAGELETLLEQWARRRALERPRRDADGRHFFVFDGEFEVALSQSGDSIYVETELTALPKRRDEAEPLLERLLKLQLARARSGCEVLSLARDKDQLVLFRILRADRLNLRGFDTALGDFVNAAAFWMEKLKPGTAPKAAPSPFLPQFFYP